MVETIGLLIQWVPTLLFILILLISFLVGFFRGFRKSLILLIHSASTALVLIGIYFLLAETNFGDELSLDIINLFLGEDGLEQMLDVSIDCIQLKEVILEYIISIFDYEDGLNIVLRENGVYIQLVVNLIYHVILALVLYVLYLIIIFILRIIYGIFYSDRKYKKKINKKFMEGKVPGTYKKRRLQGGLIGLGRGLISGFIAISMLGSTLYTITGGSGEDSPLVEHDFQDPTINSVYSIYRAVDTYGEKGIIKLFNLVKNKEEVPVYLLLTDAIMHGTVVVEDEEEVTTYNLVLREELSAYTAVLKGTFGLLVKYAGAELNSLLKGETSSDDFISTLNNCLQDGIFQSEMSKLITRLLDADYTYNLTFSLLDSILANIDEFSMDLDPSIQEICKVMFKKGHLSELIPSERVLLERKKDIVLPYISTSYFLNKDDITNMFLMIMNIVSDSMTVNPVDTVKVILNNVKELSVFKDEERKEKIEQVITRVFLILENTLLEDNEEVKERKFAPQKQNYSYSDVLKEVDPEYYELIYGNSKIEWVDETFFLIDAIEDLVFIFNNSKNEEGAFDLFRIFDKEDENYQENIEAFENVSEILMKSKVLSLVLNTKMVSSMFIETLKAVSPTFHLMEDIQYSNVYDDEGNIVSYGELYYLFNGLRLVLDTDKTDIYWLLTNGEMNVDTIKEIADELLVEDENNRPLYTYFLDSNIMRSLISALLIDSSSEEGLLYISSRTLEKNKDGEIINVIKKEELQPLLVNLGPLINELKPLMEGEEVDLKDYLENEVINGLLDNRIVQGTISNQVLNAASNTMLIIPRHLQDIDNWVASENKESELIKLFNVIKELDISLDLENIDLFEKLKDLSKEEKLDILFESEVLYYTISDFLNNNDFGDFKLVIPNQASKVLVNDSINRIIKKDHLINLINNIISLDINEETSANTIITNLVKHKNQYLDDPIISASLVKMLTTNFDESLDFPDILEKNATDSKLIQYSEINPWYQELPCLLDSLDELFGVSLGNEIDIETDLEGKLETFLDNYDENSSVVDRKTKLQVYLSSLVVSKTISVIMDDNLTEEFIIPDAKEMAKVDDIYPYDEIKALLDVMSSYGVNFNNIEDFDVKNVKSSSVLKEYLDSNSKIYLLRGVLTNQIETLFTNENNGLHSHPLAYEGKIFKKIEISSLVSLLEDSTFENFDSRSYDLSVLDKYIYNENGECESYIIASSMSHSLLNNGKIVVPTSVVGKDAKGIINISELHNFIKATSKMGEIKDLGTVDASSMEFTEEVFLSKIMNATIVKNIKITHNGVEKDEYVLANRVELDTLYVDKNQEILILKEEEYSTLLDSIKILKGHSTNLKVDLNIGFILGLDIDEVDTLLKSSLISVSFNQLLDESSYKTIIDMIPGVQSEYVDAYHVKTKELIEDKQVYTNSSIMNIVSTLKSVIS